MEVDPLPTLPLPLSRCISLWAQTVDVVGPYGSLSLEEEHWSEGDKVLLFHLHRFIIIIIIYYERVWRSTLKT
eukprot:gene10914-7572_t